VTHAEPTRVAGLQLRAASIDDGQQRTVRLPGDGHMWFMVLGDLIIFAAYFIIYMVQRAMAPEAYLQAQQHLSITIGIFNTLVLVTSSWFIAQSVRATADARHERAIRLIYGGGACGVLFIALKAYEWSMKITQGYTTSNEFFMFYYMLTGTHLFHVALGLLILGIVVRELRNPRRRRLSIVEQGATYWHMVDLLWLVIFALLYVMR